MHNNSWPLSLQGFSAHASSLHPSTRLEALAMPSRPNHCAHKFRICNIISVKGNENVTNDVFTNTEKGDLDGYLKANFANYIVVTHMHFSARPSPCHASKPCSVHTSSNLLVALVSKGLEPNSTQCTPGSSLVCIPLHVPRHDISPVHCSLLSVAPTDPVSVGSFFSHLTLVRP